MTATQKHLAGLTNEQVATLEAYLTVSLLDRLGNDKVSCTISVLTERRGEVMHELSRRKMSPSLVTMLAAKRKILAE